MQKGSYTEVKRTDTDLIEAIRCGGNACDQAMAYLYRSYVDRIIQFVVSHQGSPEEAKDVFQDAIISLLTGIREDKFAGQSSLYTYLYAISKNLWYKRFNRSVRADAYRNTLEEGTTAAPDIYLVADDHQRQIHELLGNLKDKCREVLLLWAQKYAMKEIASQLGYRNEQVVRNKKNLCLRELKEQVKQHPEVRSLIREMVS